MKHNAGFLIIPVIFPDLPLGIQIPSAKMLTMVDIDVNAHHNAGL